jgi:hypothetical protein
MSRERHDDNCPGCQPALLVATTGRPLPADHPHMIAVMAMWTTTTREEREAFHRVCVSNGREPADLAVVQALAARIKACRPS